MQMETCLRCSNPVHIYGTLCSNCEKELEQKQKGGNNNESLRNQK